MRSDSAVQKFVDPFKGSYKHRHPDDEHYWIYDAFNKHIGYAVVEHVSKKSVDVNSLKIEAQKFLRVFNKRFNPLVIWELGDKVAYIRADSVVGSIYFDTEKMEFMIDVDPKKNPVRFV